MVTDIRKATISNYIKRVIIEAYEFAYGNVEILNEFKVTAHQVRQVANTLKALHTTSLEDVLKVACWRQAGTFLTYYLRDYSQDELTGLYSLGPFIAAESMIDT